MFGAKGCARCSRSQKVMIAFMIAAAGGSVVMREARAGCSDGACGRVDWTEITDMDQGAPAAAKLHGAYAWEASPDGWATHPVSGTLSGYVWLSCLSPGAASNAVCRQHLASEMGKAGTETTLTITGLYYSADAGVIRPPWLYAEGESGKSALIADLFLGGSPINPEVCRTALAMPRNDGPVDAGTGDAGPALDATTGGAAGGGMPPGDDGGCSTSGHGGRARAGLAALAAVAAAFAVGRRRSRV